MSFISSYHDYRQDQIVVWEKTSTGKRLKKTIDAPYNFYAPDKDGTFDAITGEKLKLVEFNSKRDFEEGCYSYPIRFESDLSPQEKVMMTYYSKPVPVLTIGFVDIENDYDPKIGYATIKEPYAPINAITLYRTDLQAYFTLLLPPPEWTGPLPDDMVEDNYILFSSERELLEYFLELIQDCDVLSGWNSDFFDVPYIGKRIELLFGQSALKRLAFPDGPAPRWGEKDRFKNSSDKDIVLDLQSRVHLDYMALFKKFTLGGRQSFSLASVSEDELEIPKMKYEGTLADLYHNNFIKFALYNRRDVSCLVDLDKKFKYIELANEMVHEATVNFGSIFGSVQLIDTAIINFCHHKLNKIIFDKKHKPKAHVEGAIVLTPKVGLHKMIGSVDLRSLYPSTYRTLNLSPEKIVGQLAEYEEGWRAVYNATLHPDDGECQEQIVTIIPEGCMADEGGDDGLEITCGNFIKFLKDNKYALSAYGTILDQGNGEGLLPAVLTHWFNERRRLQGLKKEHAKLAKEALKAANGDKKDPEYLKQTDLSEYYDMLQGVKKVLLNSSYGATLNEFCRFFDARLGASCTGSGRQITTHMINTISICLLGDDAPKLIKTIEHDKKTGEVTNEYSIDIPPGIGPLYGDTDSSYFVMDGLVNTVEEGIACADAVAAQVNASFPDFIREAFHCQPGFDTLIEANREVVATAGIFRAKKKYILLVADMEGNRIDPDDTKKSLKSQGSDIKISSTPEEVRTLLKEVTMTILKGGERKTVEECVMKFRRNLNDNPDVRPLDYAIVTSVKNLDEYVEKYERIEKPGLGSAKLPNNVRSAMNHNLALDLFAPHDKKIMSGMKIKIVWLMPNDHGFASMAFSSETEDLPGWFVDNFEIDLKTTELKLVDQKLKNILEPVGWEIPTEHTVVVNKLLSFD